MTRSNNSRVKFTLHLKYVEKYCTLYSTIGTSLIAMSRVIEMNSELLFLEQFDMLIDKIIIPNNSIKFVLDKMLALLLSKKFTILIDPKIIDMQRELDKKMNETHNKSSVEIILGNKVSKGMPIPAPSEKKFTPTQRAMYFYKDARKYCYKAVEHAEFCDMSNYYGLYDTMTEPQKKWYFFWRAKVRKGEYLKTAITYINLHIFELINLIGVDNPRDGLNKIAELWHNYRQEFPLLDGYVCKWIIDYSIIYKLTGVEAVFNKIDYEWNLNEIDILLSSIENKLDLIGRFNVINFYSTYKITKSSYYARCKDREAVKRKVEIAFAAVEQYFLDKFSYSICDKYSPYYSTRTVQTPFVGALYAGTKMIDIKYKSYNGNPDFKNFVAQIVRYTEKIARQQDRYRTPLQKVDLSENIKGIIESVLIDTNDIYEQNERPKPRPEKIVVDMEKINSLIKDSYEMQQLLIDTSIDEKETTPQLPVFEKIIEKPQSINTLNDISNTLETFFSSLSGCQIQIMEILISGNNFKKINEIAVLNNTIASKIFDDINELALDTINDIIIDMSNDTPEITEQYAADCVRRFNK